MSYSKINLGERIISILLVFTMIFPIIPWEPFENFVPKTKAAEITGETHEVTVTSNYLSTIQTYLQTASQNPNDLYILTLNPTRNTTTSAITISSNTTLKTDGNVIIKKGNNLRGANLFTVNSGYTLNIGSEDMKGTIKIDGGAVYTYNTSYNNTNPYNFDADRPKDVNGNVTLGKKNVVTVNNATNILFNDGDSYRDAHWYTVSGVNSTNSLIRNNGNLNIYDGVEIGNVYIASMSSGGGGAIHNRGTLVMNGGKISWNALGKNNEGTGAAIYSGPENGSSVIRINDGEISYNTAIDYSSCSADGGAIAIDGGSLYINGGSIKNNRAATGGSDNAADGGAIIARVNANIYMYGGEIACNFAGGFGGGVLLWNSTFYMYGGKIRSNFARNGGGVGMSTNTKSTFYMFNDALVTDNFADYGGGVCVGANGYANNCDFTMFNGNITYNYAEQVGGGICNYNQSNCATNLRSGLISNNRVSSTGKGNGLGIFNQGNGTETLLYMSGAIVVNPNNNIYIDKINTNQVPVKVEGRLSAVGSVGMLSVDSWSKYNGRNIILFERTDGGALEVQTNKLAIDTDEYLLVENGQYLKLSEANVSQTGSYVARVGDRLYSTLEGAINAVEDGGSVYVISNITLTKTLEVNKTINILSETTASKNATNVIDGGWKNENGNTISSTYTYHPLGDYTITVASAFADSSSNTAGIKINNGGHLILGDENVTESSISADKGGYLVIDGNSGYEIKGSLINVLAGGELTANYGITLANNATVSGINGAGVNVAGTFNLNGANIKNNVSDALGGGIYVTGTLDIEDGDVYGNETTGNGAGIYIANTGSLRISDVTISSNKANGNNSNAGGIYLANGSNTVIEDAEIILNEAQMNGAGMYLENGAECEISGVKIQSNKAYYGNGAGIYNTGNLTMNGGNISENVISDYNTTPLGEGIYLDGDLKVKASVKVDSNNVVYMADGNLIEIMDVLSNTEALPIKTSSTDENVKVAKITFGTEEENIQLAETILLNNSIYHVDGARIVRSAIEGENNYLIIGNISVSYDANNATSGTVPVDATEYNGGDYVEIAANTGNLERASYLFMGWSTIESTPITSITNEISIPIYYKAGIELVEGVMYKENLPIYTDLTLYAVWAVDANNNGSPDYREDMYSITIEDSVYGSVSSNISEAQNGNLVMLTTMQDDGYEVKSIEVLYELNGNEEKMTLENGKIVKLTETYFYFTMPAVDVKVVTVFGEQSKNMARVTWLDENNTESIEEFTSLQLAINQIEENQKNGTLRAKKVTILRYSYSLTPVIVPEGLNFELDLAGYTLDMNNHSFTIEEGATVKFIDSSFGGKVHFNANANNNYVENYGTVIINAGDFVSDQGDSVTECTILNYGELTVNGGSIKHLDSRSSAISNNGYLTVNGGNINGGKYGIKQLNLDDNINDSIDIASITHSLNISNMGTENTYGQNLDNYISSIYLAKDTHINMPSVLGICNNNVVKTENKIDLILEDNVAIGDIILTSNKLPFLVEHLKTHFDLNKAGYEIGVTPDKHGVLIKEISSVKTESINDTYEYNSLVELQATLLDGDGNSYQGADGKIYFFTFSADDEYASWAKIWNSETHSFQIKTETADGEVVYYSEQDSIGYAEVDKDTGIAKFSFKQPVLERDKYVIYALFIGEGTYGHYSNNGDASYGYEGPIVANDRGTFSVLSKNISGTTINMTESKSYTGNEFELDIEIYDGNTKLEEGTDYEIIHDTLVDVNVYNIQIKGIGNYTGTVQKTFEILQYNEEVIIEGIQAKYDYDGNKPSISFDDNVFVKSVYGKLLQHGVDYTETYYKYNTASQTYTKINDIPSDVGVYKVVVNGTNSGNYSREIVAEAAFVITENTNNNYEIEIQNTTLTYNGEERRISELGELVVKNIQTNQALIPNVEYIASWGVSSVKNAKEYTVVVQGVGNYASLYLAEIIQIVPATITNTNTTVIFENEEFVYNARAHKPVISQITVNGVNNDSTNGGTPIVEGTDFVVAVSDNTNVGEMKVEIIALNGNYTGSIQKELSILPRDISSSEITTTIYQSGFTGLEIKPSLTIIDTVNGGSKVLIEGETQDYTIEYMPNQGANDGATISPNGYPVDKGTYDVVITGIGNYTGTRTESFVVANYKGLILAELSPNKYTYTGNADNLRIQLEEALVVTRGTDSELLEYGKDYVLGYNSPENTTPPSEVGEYVLYVVGVGNYEGTQATANFLISPLTGSIHIELKERELLYNGQKQYPEIILENSYLTINSEKIYLSDLKKDVDYTVTYDGVSSNLGTYVLQVTGVGNYAGNYNFTNYLIVAKDISQDDVVIMSQTPVIKYYDGTAQTLNISPTGDIWLEYQLEDGTVVMLEEGVDFNVYYSNNENAGIATMAIMGTGNYSNVRTYSFVIETRSIGLGTIADGFKINNIENKPFTGTAITQEIVLQDIENSIILRNGVDYDVTYENNINVGTAKVVITGRGNYSGTINLEFDIEINHTISINGETEYAYTGEKIKETITVLDSLGHVLSTNDYVVEYYIDSNYKTKTNTENSGTDVEGGAPVEAGTYYRKVVGVSDNYKDLEAKQEIIINVYEESIRVSISNTTNVYDGTNKNANVLITDSKGNVIANTDYDIVYYKDSSCATKTNAEDGAIVNGGAPRYAGIYYVQVVNKEDNEDIKAYAQFVISKRSLDDVDVSTIEDKYYTGVEIKPTPVISFEASGKTTILQENVDYIISYNNNQEPGIANVIIAASDDSRNYTGTKMITFNIIGAEELVVTLVNSQVEYTGDSWTLADNDILIGYTNGENKTLADWKKDADSSTTYQVMSEESFENVGEYEITVEVRKNGVLVETGTTILEILPKQVTIIPNALEKDYREANPTYTYTTDLTGVTVNSNGLYGDDLFVGELTRDAGESVGEYAYSINNLHADNYELVLDDTILFKINAKDINDSDIITSGVETEYTYTGNEVKPIPSIIYPTLDGQIKLVQTVDYNIISYQKKNIDTEEYEIVTSPVEVGDYRIVVEGLGNYAGIRNFDYKIGALKAFNATITNTTKEYNRENQNASVAVTSVTGRLTENVDYKLVYYKDSNYSQKTTANDASGARSEGGAPSNVGNYYLRVEGIGNYLGSSAEAEFRITAKDITAKTDGRNYDVKIADIADQTYTGEAIMPELTLTWNAISLKSDDYRVSYSNNLDVGVATVTIVGNGNYVGSRIINFNIVAITGGRVEITLTDENGNQLDDTTYVYDGTEKKPNVSVKYISGIASGETVVSLEEGKDYSVTFIDPISAGSSQISIMLVGNYSGSATTSYVISPRDLSETTINVIPVSDTYTGKAEYPEINVIYNNMVLVGNKDYTVDFGEKEYTDAGEYRIIVASSTGNYKGSVEKTYTIKPYGTLVTEYLTLDFTGDVTSYLDTTFNVLDVENSLIVKDLNGRTLSKNEYEIFYSADDGSSWSTTSATTVGSYLVRVKGKAGTNYEGQYAVATRGYAIYTEHLVANDITVTYDGKSHTVTATDVNVTTANGTPVTSDNYEVTFGNITVKEAGNYTIFITGKNTLAGTTGTATYHILPATFTTGTIAEKTYNGVQEMPELEIKGIEQTELVLAVDYVLNYTGTTLTGSYYDSIKVPTSAGNYKVKITGRANYAGTEYELDYNILPKNLTDSDIIVKLNNNNDTYNTFTHKVITNIQYQIDNHIITLVEGVDYEVVGEMEYKDAGQYTINIKAKDGNYVGETNTIYEILPYTGTLQAQMGITIFNYGTSIETIKEELTVKYGSEELTADMYDVFVYPSVTSIPEVGSYTLSVSAKTSNYASANASANASVKFTVIPASEIVISFINPIVVYNGKVQKPTETEILVEGKSIADWKNEGKNYEIDYGENNFKDAATYMITVSYYENGILKEQNVGAYTIQNAKVVITPDSNQSKVYGQVDKTLTYTTDITAGNNGLYENDILNGTITRVQGENAGEYELKQKDLIAKNYDIEVTSGIKYQIIAKELDNSDINGISISGIQSSYTYTGTAIKPIPIVTYVSDLYGTLALVENKDFKVAYKYYDETQNDYVISTSDEDFVEVGKYEVIITGMGNYAGNIEIKYEISAYVASFSAIITNNNKVYNKQNQQATVQVTGMDRILAEGTDYKIVYYTDIACTKMTTTDDKSGAMSVGGCPKNVGTYYIQVEGLGNYIGSTSKSTFVITSKDISSDEFKLDPIIDQTYIGEEIKPDVTLIWDNDLLTTNDYTVEYKNNTEIGTASIKITGKGNYSGTRETTFNIVAISGGRIEIKLYEGSNEVNDSTYVYDGTEKKPIEQVTYYSEDNETVLTKNVDYRVYYSNAVNSGTVQVTIILTGNYTGIATKTYVINKADLINAELTVIPEKITYTGSVQKPNVLLKQNNIILEEMDDYNIVYDGTFTEAGTYNVKIEAALDSNYQGTQTKTFTIEKYGVNTGDSLLLEFIDGNTNYEEGFSQITFENNLTVRDLNRNYLNKDEYEITYSSDTIAWSSEFPTDIGIHYVKVTGTGDNYAGQNDIATRAFAIYIDKININNVSKEYKAETYTINDIISDIELISSEGTVLPKDEFTISFGTVEPKDAGKYTIIVQGNRGTNYETLIGTATFTITPAKLTLTGVASMIYNGMVQIPTMEVTGVNNETVVEGKDYSIRYVGEDINGNSYDSAIAPIKVGDYEVTIIGRGNYEGSTASEEYTIHDLDLTGAELKVILNNDSITYNTSIQKPVITVFYETNDFVLALKEGTDYEVDYGAGNYKDAGIYNITINALATSNYSGSKSATFEIVPYTSLLKVELAETEFKNGVTPEQVLNEIKVSYANDVFTTEDYIVSFMPNELVVGNYVLKISAKDTNKNYYKDADAYASGVVTFNIVNATPITIDLVSKNVEYNGKEQKPTLSDIIVRDKTVQEWKDLGVNYEVDYGTGNYKAVGEYTITVVLRDANNIEQEKASIVYTIESAKVVITPDSNQSKVYGQVDEEFTYTTDIASGNNGLYEDDVLSGTITRVQGENVGEYELVQKDLFAENYDIEITAGVKYEVLAKDLDNSDIEGINITGIESTYTYTDKAIKPIPTITYESNLFGTLALVENKDFKVTYKYYDESRNDYITYTSDEELKEVGKYQVVITGIGNYSGTVEVEYEIKSYVTDFTALVTDNNKTYNKENQSATIKVTGMNKTLVEGTDYKVVYYTDIDCTETTTSENSGALIAGGAPRKVGTYYIQVEGLENYIGNISKSTFVINTKDLSTDEFELDTIIDQTYIGEEIKPNVTLTWGDYELTSEDYTLEYRNNIELGTASIKIVGKGNYSGTRETTFNIVAISGGRIEIKLYEGSNEVTDDTYVYNGTEKKPVEKVTYYIENDAQELTKDIDYTVSYTNAIDSGTVKVTITLIGNYFGTATKTYTINKANLADTEITIIPEDTTYTGRKQEPNVSIKYGDLILDEGKDYSVVYDGTFNEAGSYNVKIEAISNSNYEGAQTKAFTINKYGINVEDTLVLEFIDGNANYEEGFSQTTFENNLSVKDLNRNYLSTDEYVITYSSDNTTWSSEFPEKMGDYYVKVTGTGDNYAGKNDIAVRVFAIYVDRLNVNDLTKAYKADVYTANDITSELELTSSSGLVLDKANFTISFGDIEPRNAGKYTIIVRGNEETNYESLIGTATLTITPASLTLAEISDLTYNGNSQIPEIQVTGVNNEELVEGKDYSVKYTGKDVNGSEYDSIIAPTEAGNYKVTINGRGNYEGSTASKEYSINELMFTDGELKVILDNISVTYNTTVQKPVITVFYESNEFVLALKDGIDYEVDFGTSNYKDAGIYEITVKALSTSNYSGNKVVTFEIMPYTSKLNVELTETEYKYGTTAEQILNNLKVSYANDTFNTEDYNVSFLTDELLVGKNVLNISAKETNSNYYKDASTYANGTVEFTIAGAEVIEVALANDKVSYNATEQKPALSDIIVKDKTVQEWNDLGVNYEVDYGTGDYKAVGEYTITVVLRDINNIELEKASIVYTIEKAKIVITPDSNQSKIFGQLNPEITFTTDIETQSGLYGEDTFEGELVRQVGENIGEYNIEQGTLTSENYMITFVDTVVFKITEKNLDNTDVDGIEMSGISESYVYTGNAINPNPVITYTNASNEVLALSKDVDYEVKYQKYNNETESFEDVESSNIKEVGKYKVIVTGLNAYTGTIEKEYQITAYGSDLVVAVKNGVKTYNAEPQGIELSVSTSQGNVLVENTDYELIYYVDDSLTQKTGVTEGTDSEGMMPSKAGKYYVQVVGIGNYTDSAVVTTFVINKKDINELTIEDIADQSYTASPINPKPVVKFGDIVLVEDTDYELSYNNNIEMGTDTATVTITALADSNYTGNKTLTFSIVMNTTEEIVVILKDENGSDVTETTYTYDSEAKIPEVIVMQAARFLKAGTDYEVSYENNINAGQAKVNITLVGHYSGNFEETFTINPKEITLDMIDLAWTENVYTGSNEVPEVSVVLTVPEQKKLALENGKDYEVTNPDDSINVGEYDILIEAIGTNYTGSQNVSFKIKANTKDLIVVWKNNTNLFKSDSRFTTQTIKNEFTLKDEYGNIIPSEEYEVTFDKEVKSSGTYEMTIVANNSNYVDVETGEQASVVEKFYIQKSSSGIGGGGGATVKPDEIIPGINGNVTEIDIDKGDSLLDKVNHKGYITGYEDGTFRPGRFMTRAEVVTIFTRLLKEKPELTKEMIFTDVENHWAKENVAIMVELGIVNGYADGTFRPEGNITRAEFAAMISRFENYEKLDVDSYFVDLEKTHWAYDTINLAYDRGWISGYEDKTFRPDNSITRAEVVTIVNRVLERNGDKAYLNENVELNKFTDISNHWAYYSIIEATIGHEYNKENKNESWEYLWGEAYKVIYDMNEKDGALYKDNTAYELGDKVKLPDEVYSNNKYKFMGWSLTPDGKIVSSYKLEQEDINEYHTITFYAIWKK